MMVELTWLHVALLLVFLHFLADFPLQGEYIATNKDPASGNPNWIWIMSAHCTIHAGFVLLVTGSVLLFLLELVTHFAVDIAKCKSLIGFTTDQALHLISKFIWLTVLLALE